MPPWHADPKYGHFLNDISLSDADKEMIYKWVAAGAPEGSPADLPPPREFVSGWSLPRKPDLVLNVQAEPYRVPAKGVVQYQYFTVDPGFKEGKWITESQIIPGSAPVVHHVLCFVRPPNHQRSIDEENGLGYLAAYVPGYRITPFPKGMAKYVPAGSKLVFQMHYTAVGKEQKDLSKIGFLFAKPEELTHMVTTVSAANLGINIPPYAEDYKRAGDDDAVQARSDNSSRSRRTCTSAAKRSLTRRSIPTASGKCCSTSPTTTSIGKPVTNWPSPRRCRRARVFIARPVGTIRRTTWPIPTRRSRSTGAIRRSTK